MENNYKFPHGLPQPLGSLKLYEDCNYLIYACDYEGDERFVLEIGKELVLEVNSMTDEDVLKKFKEDMQLDDDDGEFKLQNGEWDIDSMRESIRSSELDDLTLSSTPYGRARILFEPLISELPPHINLRLENSQTMFNDWMGVVVEGLDSLSQLQIEMEKRRTKINFVIEKF
jgi:hypothetical protein